MNIYLKQKKGLLIRYIFFAIFLANIIGAYFFYQAGQEKLMGTTLIGLLGFTIGIIGGDIYCHKTYTRKWRIFRTHSIKELKEDKMLRVRSVKVLMIIFVGTLILAISLFVERGIPLFASNNNLMRSTFGVGTMGRIRAVVVWVPMSALCIFIISLIDKSYKKLAWFAIGIALMLLIFYSYKGNILWFILMICLAGVYVNGKVDWKKLFISGGIAVGIMLTMFAIWLSADYGVALEYLLKRVTQDQVDGLNYIINVYVPMKGYASGEHLLSEFGEVFFSIYSTSFDMILAELFYGQKVTWGIVQTLYGFLYIDFGNKGVFGGFFILGYLVSKLETMLEKAEQNSISGFCVKIYAIDVLIKIFLVGNPFNEIKGTMLSAIVFLGMYHVIYYILYDKKAHA